MADAIEALQRLGLSETEAKLYVALLPQQRLTGYELARAAGVQRPNVYPALERLERRGAVMRVPSEGGGVRYAAVPYERLCAMLSEEHGRAVDQVRASLRAVAAPTALASPMLSGGYDNLLATARWLISQARERILVAACPEEAPLLEADLQAAVGRGVKVGTLCLRNCPAPCGHCVGDLIQAAFVAPDGEGRWLFCLRDDEELLVGEVAPDGAAQATLTRQRPFVVAGAGLFCYAAALVERDGTATRPVSACFPSCRTQGGA